MWLINAYDKKTERLVVELATYGIDSNFVRQVWRLEDNDPGYSGEFEVTQENLAQIQEHTEHLIDLNKFDYFLGSVQE